MNETFDPKSYETRVEEIASHIRELLPDGFKPKVALTLGSGLGSIADKIDLVADPIPYVDIPDYIQTTVVGHSGNLIFGNLNGVAIAGLQGRKHFYEEGPQPNVVSALKEVTLPVYLAKTLGAELYFATNAAGGLNPSFSRGDLMVIDNHFDLFFPNALLGPTVFDSERFVPQNGQYKKELRELLHESAKKIGIEKSVHSGVYAALTGPTYETASDSQALRTLGVDAVGMSTVPEVIVASSLGMETLAISLITNVISEDGTNETSHGEVTETMGDNEIASRAAELISRFFEEYSTL